MKFLPFLKPLVRLTLACIMLVLYSFCAMAQGSFLENYIVEVKDSKAYLRWTITAGNTCNGIVISRSVNGVDYSTIGEIFGICGSDDSAETFLFTDDSPVKNKTNFYRLGFGSVGQTAVQSVFVIGENDFSLYPNPARNNTRLFFDNSSGQAANLAVYDMLGRQVIQRETKSGMFDIDVTWLPGGIYIFVLSLPGKQITGKISVVH